MTEQRLSFGPFVLDRRRAALLRDGKPLAVGQRGFALLEALVEARGGTVAKADLMEQAWPGTFVEEANLAVQIAALRKTLGKQPDGQDWIATVRRIGYRLPGPDDAAQIAAPTRPSIAVLPFANLSSDPEQGYFADGVVEELITGLSRFKTFAVIARNSSLAYKNRAVDIREVAKELGVRYVLEGSVRRSGDKVRVTAQLIEGASGAHLWAENFEGAATDVFDFQDAIVRAVIGLIEPQIRKAEIERARRKRPESLDAWDLYIQALPLVYGPSARDHTAAIALLDRAIALDPGYAPALALGAWAREKRKTVGGAEPEGTDDAADSLALAGRAFAADPDDPMVIGMLGWLRILFRRDYSGLTLCTRAVALNPNNLLVLNFAAVAHLRAGDLDEMIACATRALALSPGSPDNYVSLHDIACGHCAAGRWEEALVWAARSIELNDRFVYSYFDVALASAYLGRMAEARAAIAKALALRPDLTLAKELAGSSVRWPERKAQWIEGLRRAGLPEG